MTAITVERRPGGFVFVAGVLGHPAAVEEVAALLVDPDALDLAQKVARAAESFQELPTLRGADLYDEALAELAEYLGSSSFMFRVRALDPIVEGVRELIAEVVA